jgi:hypothetical protein
VADGCYYKKIVVAGGCGNKRTKVAGGCGNKENLVADGCGYKKMRIRLFFYICILSPPPHRYV